MIQPSSRTEHGVWVADGEVVVRPLESPPSDVGEAVRRALARSKAVPHPTTWGRLTDGLLAAAHVRSWGSFSKGARYVDIEGDVREVAFVPSRNLGAREGFEPIAEKTVRLAPSASALEWGRCVLAALDACG